MKHTPFLILLVAVFCFAATAQELYTQTGTDPTWQELLDANAFPVGQTSTGGVLGSTINVDNELLEIGSYGNRSFVNAARNIHTVCNSSIGRNFFYRWTRWYQEDGNTQIFRMFEGEHNVRNDRPDAGRVESFHPHTTGWGGGAGPWNEWTGRYTIVKPHSCAIFQARNNVNDWGIMLNMNDSGDIILNHRRHQPNVTIARNMTGKSFDIRVLDNGHDYRVWLNGQLVGTGHYDRPEGTTVFRWGMYNGTFRHDAMIFVSGATIRTNVDPEEPYLPPVDPPSEPALQARYIFDGDARDVSGNDRHGTLVNGAAFAEGVDGSHSLQLDGINDYVSVADYKGVTGTSARTVCAWVKSPGAGSNMAVAGWGTNNVPGQQYLLGIFADGGIGVYGGGPFIKATQSVLDDQWHHIAAVLPSEASAKLSDIQLYVDGVLQSTTLSTEIDIYTAATGDLLIGAYETSPGQTAGYFKGHIDDLRIYNYALDAAGIAAVMDALPPTPNPAAFEIAPVALSAAEVTMTAVTGTDDSGGVEYYFTCVEGGGADSGWQDSPEYTASGLTMKSRYSYSVKMRDIYGNETAPSDVRTVWTMGAADIDGDGAVDLGDLADLSRHWARTDCFEDELCNGADINADGQVDIEDLVFLADNWLLYEKEQATLQRVDNFDSYDVDPEVPFSFVMYGKTSPGPLGGYWDDADRDGAFHSNRTSEVIEADGSNVVRIQNRHDGFRTLAVTELADPIEDGQTGVLFFRFQWVEAGANSNLQFRGGIHGLTARPNNSLNQFTAGFSALHTNASAGLFKITTVDGTADLLTGLHRWQWYSAWIVADNGTKTYDLYIEAADGPAGKPGLPTTDPILENAPFHAAPDVVLHGGIWMNGLNDSRGSSVRIDEVWWNGSGGL